MEIPNANKYKYIEMMPDVDFLDEGLELTFSFEKEAIEHLPKVTDKDLKSGKEKYHILLGNYEVFANNKVNVHIKGVMMADREEENSFYQEDIGEVRPNLYAIKMWVADIQKNISEFRDFDFIGDIHTHPISSKNKLNQKTSACSLSEDDIKSIIEGYERGDLTSDKPFIFAVAGRKFGENKTEYVFYRLIKRKNNYEVEALEKK